MSILYAFLIGLNAFTGLVNGRGVVRYLRKSNLPMFWVSSFGFMCSMTGLAISIVKLCQTQ